MTEPDLADPQPAGKPPILSIVTISFNQAEYLERAILSVIDQVGPAFEYIVLDPGSTDGSREIIERYADRIDRIVLAPDDGAADGLNKGLALARGRYFSYLNSDDCYLPGAFAEAVAYLDAHPAVDVAFGTGWQIDEHDRRVRRHIPPRVFTAPRYARGLSYILQQSSFMRTAAARAVGGFNNDNRTCWDGEHFFAMARNGARFARVDRDWGAFRIYAASITGSGRFNEQIRRDFNRMFQTQFGRDCQASDRARAWLSRVGELIVEPRRLISALGARLRQQGRQASSDQPS